MTLEYAVILHPCGQRIRPELQPDNLLGGECGGRRERVGKQAERLRVLRAVGWLPFAVEKVQNAEHLIIEKEGDAQQAVRSRPPAPRSRCRAVPENS